MSSVLADSVVGLNITDSELVILLLRAVGFLAPLHLSENVQLSDRDVCSAEKTGLIELFLYYVQSEQPVLQTARVLAETYYRKYLSVDSRFRAFTIWRGLVF